MEGLIEVIAEVGAEAIGGIAEAGGEAVAAIGESGTDTGPVAALEAIAGVTGDTGAESGRGSKKDAYEPAPATLLYREQQDLISAGATADRPRFPTALSSREKQELNMFKKGVNPLSW